MSIDKNINVEMPSMKSLFIEMYFNETLLSSGTAILVADDRESHCTLITNRHNVTGKNQDTGKHLSKTLSEPNYIIIHFHKNNENENEWKKVKLPLYREDETPFWIEHPIFQEKADIVALNLNWGNDITKYPYYLKTNLDRVNMVITPAETISVIGFPFGLSSYMKFPIWATGFLAQELSLVSKENPTFLIDCRTRQGQSGSAVIAYRPSGFRRTEGDRIISQLSPSKTWEFLGIYSGRVNSESDLGKVWHVSAIEDLYKAATDDYNKRKDGKNKV